jgi:NADPH:quinone reductase-like Zn-dependent oxidoreductase
MLALLSKQPGGPETLVLESVAEPRPKPGEVLLAVRACGVNYPDGLIIEDRYQFKPERPFAPGSEVSGIVETLGEGVSSLKAGDRVIGSCGWGGMAEKLAISAGRCIPMPDAMPFDEAALRAIAWDGRYLAVGFPAGIPKIPLNLPLLKSCQIVGVFWGAVARRDPKGNAANLRELLDLHARGAIRPVISERVSLARAGEAIASLSARKALGKIVVTMGGADAP